MTQLDLRHLTKTYPGVRALDDVSFSVTPGAIFGFVGANGAGKTTTMRIAMGVTAPDRGDVLVDDSPITEHIRRTIGYMPEERGLYPKMRVHQQLVYLARLHGLTADAAEKSARYWEEYLEIAHRRNDTINSLSLGNQQRVQLAAALVHDPRILILDEPFSGLDPLAVETMAQALRDKATQGIPVIFSSHQLDLVERLCQNVGILSAGRLVVEGSITQLRMRHGTYTQLRADAAALRAAQKTAEEYAITYESGEDQGALLLRGLPEDEPIRRIAQHAFAAGTVTEFGLYQQSLTQMYREIVEPSHTNHTDDTPATHPTHRPRRRWWRRQEATR